MEKFTTFFKLVVYFRLRPDGTEYTPEEMHPDNKRNLKYMGSFDTRKGKFKQTIKDAEMALFKAESSILGNLHGRYKTAFVVVNNYKGFEIVILKYVDGEKRFGMGVNFFKKLTDKDDISIYNIPKGDELIAAYKAGTLTPAQKTLIKPVRNDIPTALPYYAKMSDKLAHLRA